MLEVSSGYVSRNILARLAERNSIHYHLVSGSKHVLKACADKMYALATQRIKCASCVTNDREALDVTKDSISTVPQAVFHLVPDRARL